MQAPTGVDKRKEIDKLLSILSQDLGYNKEPTRPLLERLKVLGRDRRDSESIYKSKGLNVLLKHGLEPESPAAASREALSCLGNALLLESSTRSLLVDLGAAPKIAEKYKNASHTTDEFLCARLLLLLTHGTSCDFTNLIDKHSLCESINKHSHSHAEHTSELSDEPAIPSPAMALGETLKLLFSLAKQCPEKTDLTPATRSMISILIDLENQPSKPVDPLITHLIDALHLCRIDEDSHNIWFPEEDQTALVRRLISAVHITTANHKASEMDLKLSTTMILLLHLYAHAPDHVKEFTKQGLLPHEEERDKPLGQSDTPSARLLRLSTSGYTPQLRELIPELFFQLSDRNAETFVNNVGYGYASGYLTNNKIPFVPPSGNASQLANDGTSSSMRTDVNPVTGQFLAHEPQSAGPPMTEEEKIREAERLFVLFERLKATGVVDVANPVEEAARSGQLQELDEDDD